MEYIIRDSGRWEYVIGLEVHAQISSKSKLFSGAPTKYGASANTQVSLIDAAFPGMLPVLNEYCVHQAIKTGIALNATINKISRFDRKNYFYPDLPQGYQISQFYTPIVQNGSMKIKVSDEEKNVRINRLHLEQDAGKSLHTNSANSSLIDLNRAGIALMEIVTEPDLKSPQEAAEFVKKLRSILRYVGSCDGDMEKGSMRCDANISVRKPGESLGTRCEIKNLNSMRNIVRAIEYEAIRQIEIIEEGGRVLQETRLFDDEQGTTHRMRSKEEAEDYRYFPDPDLLPVKVSDELIEQLRVQIPELPDVKLSKYVNVLGLSQYDADVIIADVANAKYFEEAIKYASPKLIANWLTSELFGLLKNQGIDIEDCKINPKMLGELVALIENKTISGKIAKNVFEIMSGSFESPQDIIKKYDLVQVSDNSVIEAIIDEVLAENQDSVTEYKGGRNKLFGFFVGQVMKKTEGKANPNIVNELLRKKLA